MKSQTVICSTNFSFVTLHTKPLVCPRKGQPRNDRLQTMNRTQISVFEHRNKSIN